MKSQALVADRGQAKAFASFARSSQHRTPPHKHLSRDARLLEDGTIYLTSVFEPSSLRP